jgi:hypothetical protein
MPALNDPATPESKFPVLSRGERAKSPPLLYAGRSRVADDDFEDRFFVLNINASPSGGLGERQPLLTETKLVNDPA